MAPHRRRKLNISLLIPFAIVAMVFGGLIWKKVQDSRDLKAVPGAGEPAATRKAVLFFADGDAKLAREGRELEACDETADCVKDLLDELFNGPVGELDEVLPEGAAVNSVSLEGDQAVVDLNRAFVSGMPPGSAGEMLAVYSIVDTVCLNYPQIARVRITVDGDRKAVLGHLDLSEPLSPDFSLERDPAAAPKPPVQKGQP